MPQVGVFISHSWSYSNHYDTLSEWIFQKTWSVSGERLHFIDQSVPKDNPIHNAPNTEALKQQIYARIASSDVVVIPTGMYANYSNWIGKEIAGAAAYRKPILAVDLWGSQRAASVVSNAARETVGWNSDSVVAGIWRLRTGG